MAFTFKSPTSKRFFQLSFEGFRPKGRNKFEQFLNTWLEFFRSVFGYVILKIGDLLSLIGKGVILIVRLPNTIKVFLTKKLIWSRGRLGRPIATGIVMGAAFVVFMFGEVFVNSDFVVNPPVNQDYLATTSDIIPRKELAVTTLPEMRQRTEPLAYTVEVGDTLYSIGSKFKVSVDALKYVNNLTDYSILKVGQTISVPPVAGLIHKVASGDTLNSIADKYDVPPQAIADFNYLLDVSHLAVGAELVIPGGKVPKVVQPAVIYTGAPSVGTTSRAAANKGFCVWPTTVRILTQYFSWYHNGVDIATPHNISMPPLLSCTSGTVVRAGWDPSGLGLHVRIDHGNGYMTIYGHMSRIDVSYGQKVGRGQIIGLMGNTGNSTGPHIHFMVEYNGVPQNPLNFMQ